MPRFLKSLVNVYASDIVQSVAFYGRVLGLEEIYRFPAAGTPEHVEFSVGGSTLAVSSPAGLRSHGMPAPTSGHPFEIGMKTDDVDAAVRELRAAGASIIREPWDNPAGNRCAYVADPDGNWISLYQNLAKRCAGARGPGSTRA
jgi:lactoylglutathione lyase